MSGQSEKASACPRHSCHDSDHSLQSKFINDCETETDEVASVNQCRRLLLAAGADPTSVSAKDGDRAGNFIGCMLDVGTTVLMTFFIF